MNKRHSVFMLTVILANFCGSVYAPETTLAQHGEESLLEGLMGATDTDATAERQMTDAGLMGGAEDRPSGPVQKDVYEFAKKYAPEIAKDFFNKGDKKVTIAKLKECYDNPKNITMFSDIKAGSSLDLILSSEGSVSFHASFSYEVELYYMVGAVQAELDEMWKHEGLRATSIQINFFVDRYQSELIKHFEAKKVDKITEKDFLDACSKLNIMPFKYSKDNAKAANLINSEYQLLLVEKTDLSKSEIKDLTEDFSGDNFEELVEHFRGETNITKEQFLTAVTYYKFTVKSSDVEKILRSLNVLLAQIMIAERKPSTIDPKSAARVLDLIQAANGNTSPAPNERRKSDDEISSNSSPRSASQVLELIQAAVPNQKLINIFKNEYKNGRKNIARNLWASNQKRIKITAESFERGMRMSGAAFSEEGKKGFDLLSKEQQKEYLNQMFELYQNVSAEEVARAAKKAKDY